MRSPNSPQRFSAGDRGDSVRLLPASLCRTIRARLTLVRRQGVPRVMQPVAVIDIGSNSLCLLVVTRLRDGSLATVAKHKHAARLRDAVDVNGVLSALAIDSTVSKLQEFAKIMANWQVCRVRAVATAALRAASNAQTLVDRAANEAGIAIEVVAGAEEARLAYLGVRHGLGTGADGPILCADVGGGSTELLVGCAGDVRAAVSTPMGALVAARHLLGDDPVGPEQTAEARAALVTMFRQPCLEVLRHLPELAVASSGTIQRVARIARACRGQMIVDVHKMVLSHAELNQVIALLAGAGTQERRLAIAAMDPTRADNLLGGALIFDVLAELLDLQSWTVSMDGLRMGVVSELAAAL